MKRLLALAAAVVCALMACSKSPTEPSTPEAVRTFEGQTVSAVDAAAVPGVSVRIGSHDPVTTDGDGRFALEVASAPSYRAIAHGTNIVDRQTTIYGPMNESKRLSLIPTSFDLAAFDEMYRTTNNRLQRWTSRPALVVLGTVMVYRSASSSEFEATSEHMTESEISQLVTHLNEGLALLTGNTFSSFASVEIERPAAGAQVNVTREGHIVVGRYIDMAGVPRAIGYGMWSEQPNGTVNGGVMFLDRDFDKGDSRRRLLRIHELGHALGYLHVTSRTSIMNPTIGPEPTDFDRTSAVIAFQRPPGNRAPDADPRPGASGGMSVVSSGGGQWRPPVVCQ